MDGTYGIKVPPIHSFTEEKQTRPILDRPALNHVLWLRKYKGQQILFCFMGIAL